MKYFKSYSLKSALWIIILIFPCSSFGFQNEPESFRGIKWGTNINELSDMVCVQKNGLKYYKKKNDKMKIGDAEIEDIVYSFYKKRFSGVIITFRDLSNFDSLQSTLFQVYGKGQRPNQFMEEYAWLGTNIWIFFKYNEISKKGSINYYYYPLWNEYKKEQKEAAKKGADDL